MKEIRIYSESGLMPSYANSTDSGMDLKSIDAKFIINTLRGEQEVEFNKDKLVEFFMSQEFYVMSMKVKYHSGIHLILPPTTDVELRPKSSIYKKAPYLELSNGIGTIDEEYRGSCDAVFNIISMHLYYITQAINQLSQGTLKVHVRYVIEMLIDDLFKGIYNIGDSFSQLVVTNREEVRLIQLPEWLPEYNQTSRGQGGFGSTNN